jgi:hypothetical protein
MTAADAEQAIRNYLAREMRRDVVSLLVDHPANLIVFGEIHFTFDPFKAFLLSELIRPVRLRRPVTTHFHASERFPAGTATRKAISDFLQAAPGGRDRMISQLSLPLQTFLPVLAMAMDFPNRRYAVLGIDPIGVRHEDPRHTAIFQALSEAAAMCPDVPGGSINSTTSRGSILLGARHAARLHVAGRAATTVCGRLAAAGWKVHAVRLTVPPDGGASLIPEDLNLVLRTSPRDQTPIDVLKIANGLAAGRPFYADLTKNDSPFGYLREADPDAADIPYNKLFDAIVHISAATVPFPVS